MSRQERKNMITFIETMKGIDRETLMYMTDADIEHIYTSAYKYYEEHLDMWYVFYRMQTSSCILFLFFRR